MRCRQRRACPPKVTLGHVIHQTRFKGSGVRIAPINEPSWMLLYVSTSQVYFRVGPSVCRELATHHWTDETIKDQCEYLARLNELQQVRAVTTINFRKRGLATPCFDLRKHSNREPRGAERVITRATISWL
jgi:hypothetical protein